MSKKASQKDGIEIPSCVIAVIIDEYHLSDFAVIWIDKGMAIISDKNKEKNVKYRVTGSFLKKRSLTGTWYFKEVPIFSFKISFIQFPYLTKIGLSSPSSFSRARTWASSASVPKIISAGFPGRTWKTKKIIRLTKNKVRKRDISFLKIILLIF